MLRPTIDAVLVALKQIKAPLDFILVNKEPDSSFPNGIPNPLLPQNHSATANIVKKENADFGVAFDGDFDRCFFFDSLGEFIPSEYIVGLLASVFLKKEPGSKIVHDPRVIWNTQDIVKANSGISVQSKTGHAIIKKTMRDYSAIYGGEISAHHYFRDFAFCDSGMIPWILIAELVSRSDKPLRDLVRDRTSKFPSSGEINFTIKDVNNAFSKVLLEYEKHAISLDKNMNKLIFDDWRFNLRKSDTEPTISLMPNSVQLKNLNENVKKFLL